MKKMLVGVWSPFKGRANNTLNCVSLAARISTTNKLKTLIIDTNSLYKSSLQDFFGKRETAVLTSSCLDTVIDYYSSGRLSPSNASNYCQTVIADRLDYIEGTNDNSKTFFWEKVIPMFDILKDSYDFTFLDLPTGMELPSLSVLTKCDLVIVNICQNISLLSQYFSSFANDPYISTSISPIYIVSNYSDKCISDIYKMQRAFQMEDIYPLNYDIDIVNSVISHKFLKRMDEECKYTSQLDEIIHCMMRKLDISEGVKRENKMRLTERIISCFYNY